MRLLNERSNTQTSKPERSPQRADVEKKSTGGRSVVKKIRLEKMSKSEVRQKLKERSEELEKEKAAAQVNVNSKRAQMLKSKDTQAASGVKIIPEGEPIGDVKVNDPTDTNVHEKLKGALTTSSFNFSEKEREVLSKILA